MKKILIFSLTYPPFVGGAEVAIQQITDRLGDDISFDMVTLRFDSSLPEVERIGNVTLHRIGFTRDNVSVTDLVSWPLKLNKFLFPFLAYNKAVELHKRNNYDGIWAMMAAFAGFAASFFKRKHPEIPYLLTLQEGDPIPQIKKKVRFIYPLFEKIFTRADVIQVISTYLGGWAQDMGFKKRIYVVPNAVDTKHFSRKIQDEKLDELKKKIGKKEGDFFLITTSRLVLKNAVDDVIKSLSFLPKNVRFLVLGTGPDEEMLRKLAKDEGVQERVVFVGQVQYKKIPEYLAISDIFIRPSLSEGFGNSFVEAMASGIPVIATQEGGIADFLFDPERDSHHEPTGFAVNPRDPAGIAHQVNKVLNERDLTERVVSNAKDMVFEKYDWEIIAKDMRKVFGALLG